jgi:hypothetical protein
VGVEGADPDVREGDEVVVMHKDEVRGVGVAKMSAESMTHLKRGVAVMLRHTAAQPATDSTKTTEQPSVPSVQPVAPSVGGGRA